MTRNRLEQLLTFLKENPDDSFILFAIAKEYEKLQEIPKALSYYQKLVALDPDYVGTYYHLGKLYESKDEKERALTIYQQGIDIAKKVKDQHALSELMGVKMNLEIE